MYTRGKRDSRYLGGTLVPYSLSSKNCEGLTEKVSSLGLQSLRKNHSGAAKKRARKARLAEAPTRGL